MPWVAGLRVFARHGCTGQACKKAHGSQKSLTVVTPARDWHGGDLTLNDFDGALPPAIQSPLEKGALEATLI